MSTSTRARTKTPTLRRSEGAYLLARIGLTQKAIGEKLGVDVSNVNRWIAGETKPRAEQRKELLKLFGIEPPDWDRMHAAKKAAAEGAPSATTAPLAAALTRIANRDAAGEPYLIALATKIAHAEMRTGESADLTATEADKRIATYEALFEEHLKRLQTSDVRWLLANYDRTIAEVCTILEAHPELRRQLADILDKVDEGRLLKRNF